MKNWYLLFCVFLIFGCSEEITEQEFSEITIEQHYPYFSQTREKNGIDDNTLELFNQKIFLINSINQLNENPLFEYCPKNLKEELRKCDFSKNTLIMIAFSVEYELIEVVSIFGYNSFLSEFVYNQNVLCKSTANPSRNIYLIVDAFSVKKIPNDSKLTCGRIIGLTN